MKSATKPFAICVDDTAYEASLILGKVCQILPDPKAAGGPQPPRAPGSCRHGSPTSERVRLAF